jgi:hypothetical protein
MSDQKYTPADVVAGFGGAVTFSAQSAAAVASALNAGPDLGALAPDDAAKAVQRAVFDATDGARVSIDTCLAALTGMHVRHAAAGATVGPTDQEGAARATSSPGGGGTTPSTPGGTAAASGAASVGAGAGADPAKAAGASKGKSKSKSTSARKR